MLSKTCGSHKQLDPGQPKVVWDALGELWECLEERWEIAHSHFPKQNIANKSKSQNNPTNISETNTNQFPPKNNSHLENSSNYLSESEKI